MQITNLHHKNEILSFLRQNTYLHLYGIGDLDDFFWPYTTWYALKCEESIEAVVLIYSGMTPPVLVALDDDVSPLRNLLMHLLPMLPMTFYAHLNPGLETTLDQRFALISHGPHYKMALSDASRVTTVDTTQVMSLTPNDYVQASQLYEISYPGHAFDPRMLETGQFIGLRDGDQLISIAGIHVYSEAYRVAALGNITTHPAYRGRGLARTVTAKLCQMLLESVDHIGLNVKADNIAAIKLYQTLGFEVVAPYEEFTVTLK